MPISSATWGLAFVPDDVLKAMEKIHRTGSDVWIVGGALRDFLLGVEPKDWDLATSANVDKITSIFPRVIPVGIRHGTVQVQTRTRDIEVTSFDPAGEAGILKDLGRRDFTMNSLALSYPDGILLDPHGGREDLDAGLIRAVGDAKARFSEDPLRIVRAARICGIYGFRIDRSTFDAMREMSGKLENVSGERIREEILKILLAVELARAFDLLRISGALGGLLPRLDAGVNIETVEGSGVSILEHTLLCIINCPKETRIRLAALFHIMGAQNDERATCGQESELRRKSARIATETMKKWNVSNRCINEVSTLVAHQLPLDAHHWSDAAIRRFITSVGPELIDDFISLAEAEMLSRAYAEAPLEGRMGEATNSPQARNGESEGVAIDFERNPSREYVGAGMEDIGQLRARMKEQLGRISALSVRELALSGDEIMKILDLPPGPEVGKILKHLFDLVLEDPDLNTRKGLARIVEKERELRD